MRKIFFIASALIATSAAVSAQGPSAIRLRLEPGSQLSISGTSSLHDFTCKTQKMNVYVDVDPNYTKDLTKISNPIVSVQVNIPVRNLKCENGKIDENMYKTLKADKNAVITYILSGYDILAGSASANGFAAKTKGTLTVAGQKHGVHEDQRQESWRGQGHRRGRARRPHDRFRNQAAQLHARHAQGRQRDQDQVQHQDGS